MGEGDGRGSNRVAPSVFADGDRLTASSCQLRHATSQPAGASHASNTPQPISCLENVLTLASNARAEWCCPNARIRTRPTQTGASKRPTERR